MPSASSPELLSFPLAAPRPVRAPLTYWHKLLIVILLVKGVLLCIDHAPMFYLGDSIAYISTAKWGWVPTDRSFFYGWIIFLVALSVRSLLPLLITQTLAGAACSMLVAYILRRFFAAPPLLAALMALLCAVEPLQLFMERYVMTEAFSLLAFALFTTASLVYLHAPTFRRLLWVQLYALLVIALRVSFLPDVEAATVLLPLLALAIRKAPALRPARRPWKQIASHLALSLILFVSLQTAYKGLYAWLIQSEIPGAPLAYNYDGGFHLLCFVAPIVQPSDFPRPDKAAEIFHTAFDLKDPEVRYRQRWEKGGLIDNIWRTYPNHVEANHLAQATAVHAVLRDPLGELRLAWYDLANFYNREHLYLGMRSDRGGDRELPPDFLDLLHTYFHLSAKDQPYLVTLTNTWYFAAWPWYLALLWLPLPALLAVLLVPRAQRPAAFLLFTFASLQLAVIAGCSIGPTVRFLHATAWLAMLTGGILLTSLFPARNPPLESAPN